MTDGGTVITPQSSMWKFGSNALYPPITSLTYGLALALANHLQSYDYIVSQPSVLGPEASRRFREITSKQSKPLTDPPLPLDGSDA